MMGAAIQHEALMFFISYFVINSASLLLPVSWSSRRRLLYGMVGALGVQVIVRQITS